MSAPTVRRRRLGSKLRALRGDLTLEEVADLSKGRFVYSKLSRIETARSAPKEADIAALLDLYAQHGRDVSEELRSALLMLAKEGPQRGWWHSYRGVLSPTFEDLISLEAEAESVSTWQIGVIPGFFQTPEYAREIIKATGMAEAVEENVEALVEVRLARQAVITRPQPLNVWAIVSELALQVGSARPGLMRDQLSRLLDAMDRPNVNVQVMPNTGHMHVGLVGSFSMLSFGAHTDLDVVHTEGLTSALYIEDADKIAAHRHAWQRISSAALSVESSADLIAKIRNDHDH
ncbi:helix-turn-helix transcriptional regulator [Streptomyces sp. NPDC047046]|uniref:helix-turn-helix domain-containing protein n=1 Tax=Streptomyces sp. NPDC047046 TaxID=3155378 RepID=UPI0033DF1303